MIVGNFEDYCTPVYEGEIIFDFNFKTQFYKKYTTRVVHVYTSGHIQVTDINLDDRTTTTEELQRRGLLPIQRFLNRRLL